MKNHLTYFHRFIRLFQPLFWTVPFGHRLLLEKLTFKKKYGDSYHQSNSMIWQKLFFAWPNLAEGSDNDKKR